jgi:hypothetical protein
MGIEHQNCGSEEVRLEPASRGELTSAKGMLSVMCQSPLFKALLNWVDGFIMVLGPDRQVLAVSQSILDELGLDGDEVVGKRPGELFGCNNVDEAPAGCGTGLPCCFCGAMRAIEKSARSDEPVDGECKLTLRGTEPQVTTQKYRVRATRAPTDSTDLTVLVFQRAGDARPRIVRSLDARAESLVGYGVIRKLGEGGMGSVYLVESDAGKRLALKLIRADAASASNPIQRFDLEASICHRLIHPNIVRTLETGRTPEGVLYSLSEYCPNGSTYRYLQLAGPLPVDLALYWLIEVCRALNYVWREHHVVHRDIKPDNLLIDGEAHLKLADFGLARTAGHFSSRLTMTGTLIGSPSYMSPEQIEDDVELDVRSDLYSIGATFFELISGRPLFDEPNAARIMLAHLNTPPMPLEQLKPELPLELCACINWVLNKPRDHRPRDATELLEPLVELATSRGICLETPPPLISGGSFQRPTISPFDQTAVLSKPSE